MQEALNQALHVIARVWNEYLRKEKYDGTRFSPPHVRDLQRKSVVLKTGLLPKRLRDAAADRKSLLRAVEGLTAPSVLPSTSTDQHGKKRGREDPVVIDLVEDAPIKRTATGGASSKRRKTEGIGAALSTGKKKPVTSDKPGNRFVARKKTESARIEEELSKTNKVEDARAKDDTSKVNEARKAKDESSKDRSTKTAKAGPSSQTNKPVDGGNAASSVPNEPVPPSTGVAHSSDMLPLLVDDVAPEDIKDVLVLEDDSDGSDVVIEDVPSRSTGGKFDVSLYDTVELTVDIALVRIPAHVIRQVSEHNIRSLRPRLSEGFQNSISGIAVTPLTDGPRAEDGKIQGEQVLLDGLHRTTLIRENIASKRHPPSKYAEVAATMWVRKDGALMSEEEAFDASVYLATMSEARNFTLVDYIHRAVSSVRLFCARNPTVTSVKRIAEYMHDGESLGGGVSRSHVYVYARIGWFMSRNEECYKMFHDFLEKDSSVGALVHIAQKSLYETDTLGFHICLASLQRFLEKKTKALGSFRRYGERFYSTCNEMYRTCQQVGRTYAMSTEDVLNCKYKQGPIERSLREMIVNMMTSFEPNRGLGRRLQTATTKIESVVKNFKFPPSPRPPRAPTSRSTVSAPIQPPGQSSSQAPSTTSGRPQRQRKQVDYFAFTAGPSYVRAPKTTRKTSKAKKRAKDVIETESGSDYDSPESDRDDIVASQNPFDDEVPSRNPVGFSQASSSSAATVVSRACSLLRVARRPYVD